MKRSDFMRRLSRQLIVPFVGALFSFFFLAQDGAKLGSDATSYLAHSRIRTPIYPLTLDLFQWLFGPRYPACLAIFQISLVLGAALYLTATLHRRYSPGGWVVAIGFLILISPLYGNLRIGNCVMTEAVAYGLFLVCAALAAEAAHSLETRPLLALAALTALNLLVRPQLAFMVPAFFFLLVWIAVKTGSLQRMLRPAAFMLLAGLGAWICECGYNLHFNGIFTTPQIAASCLARDALYVSDSPDLELFQDAAYYPAMRRIYAEMDAGKLFAKYRHEQDANLARYYARAVGPQFPYRPPPPRLLW